MLAFQSVLKISADSKTLKINLDYPTLIKIYDIKENIPVVGIIYILIVDEIMGQLKNNSFYIPQGSVIFDDLNQYMINELKGFNNSSNIKQEFLGNVLKINNGTRKGYYYELACEIEKEILQGEIQIKSKELRDELVFVDEKNNLELDLNLISSSNHELIPIIVYLKYYLKKGDTLIIEDIENHLHQENQLIIIKYLVKAINNGLNIILTTHSNYIVEQFNNLIQLECKKEVSDYDESCILDCSDISIYSFEKNDEYSFTAQEFDDNL